MAKKNDIVYQANGKDTSKLGEAFEYVETLLASLRSGQTPFTVSHAKDDKSSVLTISIVRSTEPKKEAEAS